MFDLDEVRSVGAAATAVVTTSSIYIPFDMIRSDRTPSAATASKVVLKSGVEVVLDEGQDVSESNDGIVVLQRQTAEKTTSPGMKSN